MLAQNVDGGFCCGGGCCGGDGVVGPMAPAWGLAMALAMARLVLGQAMLVLGQAMAHSVRQVSEVVMVEASEAVLMEAFADSTPHPIWMLPVMLPFLLHSADGVERVGQSVVCHHYLGIGGLGRPLQSQAHRCLPCLPPA